MGQLSVIRVFVIRNDRHAIIDLVAKRVSGVIDQQNVFEVPICDHPQILYENTVFGLDAIVPVKPRLDQLSFRIDEIQNSVGIRLVTRREANNLEMFLDRPQSF